MIIRKNYTALLAIAAALFISACGSSSSTPEEIAQPTTGTVALWFTDLPSDDYDSIFLKVSEAVLIGGDDSQQVLFQDDDGRDIDLLNLTNYSEPVVFGEVLVGNYKKLRLMIDSIELVPSNGDPAFFVENLPANGKIDLLQPEGFDVLPGRMLTIEIDVDANKSLKITNAGNSGKVQFRPVVKVKIFDEDVPNKLARLEGAVFGEPDAAASSFVLCSIDAPDHCVDIATNDMTSFFDDLGLGTDFGGLSDGAMVVVIGEYSSDPILLNALVVEIGGNEMQVTGQVVSEPAESQFLVLTIGGEDVVVELQPGTKFYDALGPIGADAVVLGASVEVEGVMPPKADEADPDLIRAALVFLEAPDEELLSGLVKDPIEAGPPQTFVLATDGGDTNVCVNEGAVILLVDTVNSEVTPGAFSDLVADQAVDLFGMMAEDLSCFEANEVIIDASPAP